MSNTGSNNGRFKPGHPGGPGRPKGSVSLTTKLRQQLGQEAKFKDREPGHGITYADILAKKVVDMALAGDARMITLIYDRIDGKVPENLGASQDDAVAAVRQYLLGVPVEGAPPG